MPKLTAPYPYELLGGTTLARMEPKIFTGAVLTYGPNTYTVHDRLGGGGMGDVFAAVRTGILDPGTPSVIKVPKADILRRPGMGSAL